MQSSEGMPELSGNYNWRLDVLAKKLKFLPDSVISRDNCNFEASLMYLGSTSWKSTVEPYNSLKGGFERVIEMRVGRHAGTTPGQSLYRKHGWHSATLFAFGRGTLQSNHASNQVLSISVPRHDDSFVPNQEDEDISRPYGEILRSFRFQIGLHIADALDDLEILKYFAAYLHSTDPRLRELACTILGNISVHGSSPLALLDVAPYIQIVSLLQDDTGKVQRKALSALSKMTHWFHGAQAVIDAKTLEYVPDIRDSADAQAREWTCEMLGNLAYHGHIRF
ncbi:hypothetical protein C8F04DRAFT_1192173 [Mycena alexandri]|uniref:Uncharacterized protein n=1 Tax=Mycena alexandri TaxID=1745969 RepID=A0AAD6SB74_9AGAR|nr:hypothetical protein C8F04DRAFT_1192173 [Mycena alexandri]